MRRKSMNTSMNPFDGPKSRPDINGNHWKPVVGVGGMGGALKLEIIGVAN